MRNYFFRAKDSSNEWVIGYFGSKFNCRSKEYEFFIMEEEYCHTTDKYYFIDIEVDKKTIGQSTGVFDKNGVEIYEGDILLDYEIELERQQDISGKLPVVYDSSKCQFSVDNSFKKDGSSLVNFVEYFGIENLEVVGNIHDNPELLFVF